jgi:hypothetical protein
MAGLSLSLASGASAAPTEPALHAPMLNVKVAHNISLFDEEISDVSLATFYVIDREHAGTSRPGVRLARGRCVNCAKYHATQPYHSAPHPSVRRPNK